MSKHNEALERFLEAQKETYKDALKEIKAGHKVTHWMWWIFPQYKGLGYSEISKFYAIQSVDEACEYFLHPILGRRLRECMNALLDLKTDDAVEVFGAVDAQKLKSCLTLFGFIGSTLSIMVLNKFFNGEPDNETIRLLIKE